MNTEIRTDTIVAFCLAASAAIFIKVPALFGIQLTENSGFYVRNLSLFVFPLLTGYFIWKRQPDSWSFVWFAVTFVAAGIFANIYPFEPDGDIEALTALHLPIALWMAVGVAYAGGRWGQAEGRMEFVRFSGEFFIHYVLIALGGGVLIGLMASIFGSIEIDIEPFFESWILPCGSVGAVLIASWLVDANQGKTWNIAPILARLFTPMFTLVLITFLGTLFWTGRALDIERDVLITFDFLLVVVLCLMIYSVSSRDPQATPGIFDYVQVLMVLSALVADLIALWAVSMRITELGFTPNRVAALGVNVILLVNLAWSAVLYVRFLNSRSSFHALERWQTDYLPIYIIWAVIVIAFFPPLFGYT